MGQARKPDLRELGFQWRESVVTARAPSPYRLSVQVRKSYCVLKQPPVKDRGYFFCKKNTIPFSCCRFYTNGDRSFMTGEYAAQICVNGKFVADFIQSTGNPL